METIDLHVHSCYSDGSLTPTELVALALNTGLTAFALTDHDTTDGIDEALQAATNTGLDSQSRWCSAKNGSGRALKV